MNERPLYMTVGTLVGGAIGLTIRNLAGYGAGKADYIEGVLYAFAGLWLAHVITNAIDGL